MNRYLLLLALLAACAPKIKQQDPPPPPKYDTVAVERITADIPGVGVRTWDVMLVKSSPYENETWLRFYDANTGRGYTLADRKWVVLREFKEYRIRRLSR